MQNNCPVCGSSASYYPDGIGLPVASLPSPVCLLLTFGDDALSSNEEGFDSKFTYSAAWFFSGLGTVTSEQAVMDGS